MCAIAPIFHRLMPLLVLLSLAARGERLMAQSGSASNAAPITLTEIEGQKVEVLRAGATAWDPASTKPPYNVLKPGDQLRTGERSRAVVRWHDLTVLRVGELSRLQIPAEEKKRSAFNFLRGLFYFFHRDTPGEFELRTPTVAAVVRGTEFNLKVAEDDATTLSLIDGLVEMTNDFGQLNLKSGEAATAEKGKAPERTAFIEAANIIQWVLYYPGILDAEELALTAPDEQLLAKSLAAYRQGDLLAALDEYPAGRAPESDAEKVYFAALLLAVGQVERSETLLASLAPALVPDDRLRRLADALRKLVAAVKQKNSASARPPALATEWLAESYYQQSQSRLEPARAAARNAAERSPNFGFAWVRLAEMEFSFGRIGPARDAVERSLRLSPRDAQALALKGFLLAAQNKIPAALTYFDRAIDLDGALGNAWLGRGLCRIRRGQSEAGRQDLQVAATLEPNRAALRSYLGKAFGNAGDNRRALKELALAQQLDPMDPTAWLYSALIKQQESRINEGIDDLEKSEELNNNRSVYRSRLLLDQDRAVRGANLAGIYADAGMADVSLREAARAVNADYANFSAHLFLANSYDALRDNGRINLRYETPALDEYLVGNLLADARAGTLSPYITQQEYGKLFERDRLGFSSDTEYLSRGDWSQTAAQYGLFGDTSYAAEVAYNSLHGQRPNNDLDQTVASLKAKQHLTPQDSIYLQGIWSWVESGDLTPNYFNVSDPGLRVKERQDWTEPILLAGYHHEWAPGSHTLFLGGRLEDRFLVTDPNQSVLLLAKNGAGQVIAVPLGAVDRSVPLPTSALDYRSEFEAYTAELQQIWQNGSHTLVLGARYQNGTFDTRSALGISTPTQLASNSTTYPGSFQTAPISQSFATDLQRLNFYAYENWQVFDPLLVSAGVAYDRLYFPQNFRNAPLLPDQETDDQVSPKAGLIWTPTRYTTLRGAYTRSLGGVSFDQSFQLEPSQVAGFNQSYRSLIPEAVAGAIASPHFETASAALDQKFAHGTYLGVEVEWLHSVADRKVGAVDLSTTFPFAFTSSSTREHLNYYEKNLAITLNQLVGENFSFGARYRLSDADLERQLPDIPTSVTPRANLDDMATLHQVSLFTRFNHPSGLLGQVESLWTQQSNRGDSAGLPGDDFWQVNAFIGYRFPRRVAEVRVGVLNLTGQDYRLNPLNLTADLPRHRTVMVSFRFNW